MTKEEILRQARKRAELERKREILKHLHPDRLADPNAASIRDELYDRAQPRDKARQPGSECDKG